MNSACTIASAGAPDDPFGRGRPGFEITVASGFGVPPIVLALARLPARDRLHHPGCPTWWVAEEHLPVLRRFLPDYR